MDRALPVVIEARLTMGCTFAMPIEGRRTGAALRGGSRAARCMLHRVYTRVAHGFLSSSVRSGRGIALIWQTQAEKASRRRRKCDGWLYMAGWFVHPFTS